MRSSQESDKHQQNEGRIRRRNSDGGSEASMCVRGGTRLEDWIILPFDLFIPSMQSVKNFTVDAATNPP